MRVGGRFGLFPFSSFYGGQCVFKILYPAIGAFGLGGVSQKLDGSLPSPTAACLVNET